MLFVNDSGIGDGSRGTVELYTKYILYKYIREMGADNLFYDKIYLIK